MGEGPTGVKGGTDLASWRNSKKTEKRQPGKTLRKGKIVMAKKVLVVRGIRKLRIGGRDLWEKSEIRGRDGKKFLTERGKPQNKNWKLEKKKTTHKKGQNHFGKILRETS